MKLKETYNLSESLNKDLQYNPINPGNSPTLDRDNYDLSSSKQSFYQEKVLGKVVLSCNEISKTYKLSGSHENIIALRNVSLNENSEFYAVKEGEFLFIRGPSGGKTTLLNIIGSLDSEFDGE